MCVCTWETGLWVCVQQSAWQREQHSTAAGVWRQTEDIYSLVNTLAHTLAHTNVQSDKEATFQSVMSASELTAAHCCSKKFMRQASKKEWKTDCASSLSSQWILLEMNTESWLYPGANMILFAWHRHSTESSNPPRRDLHSCLKRVHDSDWTTDPGLNWSLGLGRVFKCQWRELAARG